MDTSLEYETILWLEATIVLYFKITMILYIKELGTLDFGDLDTFTLLLLIMFVIPGNFGSMLSCFLQFFKWQNNFDQK